MVACLGAQVAASSSSRFRIATVAQSAPFLTLTLKIFDVVHLRLILSEILGVPGTFRCRAASSDANSLSEI
jgi:hypothetical protein